MIAVFCFFGALLSCCCIRAASPPEPAAAPRDSRLGPLLWAMPLKDGVLEVRRDHSPVQVSGFQEFRDPPGLVRRGMWANFYNQTRDATIPGSMSELWGEVR